MKDDTVSRAAVMQSLTREYNRRRTGDGLKLAWIEKAVDEVPAVQPKDPENGSASCINPEKMHDRTMDDCISRQAAIDALMKRDKELRNINWYDKPFAEGECKGIDYALEIVNALPSVQPTQSNAYNALKTLDCIDRQAAIEKLISNLTYMHTFGADRSIDLIEELPAVQPEPKPDKNGSEPFGNAEMLGDRTTDDCISRQAAIKTLEKGLPSEPLKSKYTEGITVGFGLAITWIEQLPAVQSEIIHCKECLHKIMNGNHYECNYWDFEDPKDDGFCSFAERRTDEQNS